ncbi:MAG: hypothetical protein CBE33_06535 [Candidatus Pelagibacter sp. TMED273]|nr:MAG: hypothetical protein CBE33_06535 [Candidatus Pelagibacter sp. TMED273]|tara:strand:+ start:4282 stop:4758 length:477 start_codon:yes stop_codon:yes gene_type:complete
MTKVITKIFLFIFLSSTLGCGFKVLNEFEQNNFTINDIQTSGDKRINFKIKNNLLTYSKKDSQNILLLNLNSKKIKSIKEKNIKNEITKYQISLITNVEFSVLNVDTKNKINISSEGEYLVADNYSTTLNNEKKLIDDLIENISEEIIKKISIKLDDI